ncbi:hypothetical protein EVAR_42560_1 [Eumeta japonica]|uniref:Uncharacterized protein n=1 Tax=Eumeta variegata TaxID=151549 RepID=A0A4C1WSM7_EUMVA|nr:hypothetical protein EVAR_42560_1 [Eumeta japonica]
MDNTIANCARKLKIKPHNNYSIKSAGQGSHEDCRQKQPTAGASQGPWACRSLSIPAAALLCYTADGCRGGRLHLDIGAAPVKCCGEAMTCAM